MSENSPESAHCHTERVDGGVTVLEVGGELDISTAPLLASRLDALTAGPRPDLVLDLRPVSFMDCSGLSLLCRARNRTAARHGRLRLVCDSNHFLRILEHARLADTFEIHPRLPDAPPASRSASRARTGTG